VSQPQLADNISDVSTKAQHSGDATLEIETTTTSNYTLGSRVNLVRELAVTQFKLKYTGSALGYIWSLMKPLMLFGVMYAVFSRLLRVGQNSPNFTFQLLVGIVVWTFFAETVTLSVNVMVTNAHLIKKAAFPRPILVIASSVSALLTFAINMTIAVTIGLLTHQISVGWRSFLVFPLFAELYILILGLALFLSTAFVYYRDVGHIWEVFSLALFYGSGVVYPLTPDFLHAKAKLLLSSPVAQVIEDVRHVIVTPLVPSSESTLGPWLWMVPYALVLLAISLGTWLFRKFSPRFAEYL